MLRLQIGTFVVINCELTSTNVRIANHTSVWHT